jgi:hypothetical protein
MVMCSAQLFILPVSGPRPGRNLQVPYKSRGSWLRTPVSHPGLFRCAIFSSFVFELYSACASSSLSYVCLMAFCLRIHFASLLYLYAHLAVSSDGSVYDGLTTDGPMLPSLPWVLLVALVSAHHPASLLYALVWSPPVALSEPPVLPSPPTPAWTQVADCLCCLSRSRRSPVLSTLACPCWMSLLPPGLSTLHCHLYWRTAWVQSRLTWRSFGLGGVVMPLVLGVAPPQCRPPSCRPSSLLASPSSSSVVARVPSPCCPISSSSLRSSWFSGNPGGRLGSSMLVISTLASLGLPLVLYLWSQLSCPWASTPFLHVSCAVAALPLLPFLALSWMAMASSAVDRTVLCPLFFAS